MTGWNGAFFFDNEDNCVLFVSFGREVTIKGVLVHLTDDFKQLAASTSDFELYFQVGGK